MDSAVLISLGSLVLGSLLTFGLEAVRHRISRAEAIGGFSASGAFAVVCRLSELRTRSRREPVTGKGMVYASSDYWIAYDLVAKSRDALIKAARG